MATSTSESQVTSMRIHNSTEEEVPCPHGLTSLRSKTPKTGRRARERNILVSTGLFWVAAGSPKSTVGSDSTFWATCSYSEKPGAHNFEVRNGYKTCGCVVNNGLQLGCPCWCNLRSANQDICSHHVLSERIH